MLSAFYRIDMSWVQWLEGESFVVKWLEGRPFQTKKAWARYIKDFCEKQGISASEWVVLPEKEVKRVGWKHLEVVARRSASVALNVRAALDNLYKCGTEGERINWDNLRHGLHHIKYIRNDKPLRFAESVLQRVGKDRFR